MAFRETRKAECFLVLILVSVFCYVRTNDPNNHHRFVFSSQQQRGHNLALRKNMSVMHALTPIAILIIALQH